MKKDLNVDMIKTIAKYFPYPINEVMDVYNDCGSLDLTIAALKIATWVAVSPLQCIIRMRSK